MHSAVASTTHLTPLPGAAEKAPGDSNVRQIGSAVASFSSRVLNQSLRQRVLARGLSAAQPEPELVISVVGRARRTRTP